MTLCLLPARGLALNGIDARTAEDVAAYRAAFQVVAPHELRRAGGARVLNLTGVLPALRARVQWGVPYVLGLGYDHALVARLHGRPLRAVALGALRRVAVQWAAGVLCSAHDLARRFGLEASGVPYRVVPNGVDLRVFWPSATVDRPPLIVGMGRLSCEKGWPLLVEAAARVGWPLQLLGEGADRAALAAQARALGVTLFLPGRVPWRDVPRWLREATVFALPSLAEGSPKALGEAMACGLPCVVSDRVPDTGRMPVRVVPPTVEGLALGLRTATPEWGERAREYAVRHLDLRQTLAAEVAFVREILSTWTNDHANVEEGR